MSNKVKKLADKFSYYLKTTADIDALESYPGEDSSNQEKLDSANKAVLEDFNHIMSSYYMYESQQQQAQKQMLHQKYLVQFAKKVQQLIEEMIKNGNRIDSDYLKDQISEIEHEASALGKQIHTKISLIELTSLRLLKAFLSDEVAKTLPRLPAPNWSELSRMQKELDSDDEITNVITEDDLIPDDDDDEVTVTRTVPRLSDTLRSPGAPEHTNTVVM